MINAVVRVCAVPFGYVHRGKECEGRIHNDICLGARDMAWATPPPLPDVIQSNTPPPSPDRLGHSTIHYPWKTSAKSDAQVIPTLTPTPGASYNPSSREKEAKSCLATSYDKFIITEEACAAAHDGGVCLQCCIDTYFDERQLPHLVQEVLRPRRCRQEPRRASVKPGRREHDESVRKGRRWRCAGRNLRQMADLFEANFAKDGVGMKVDLPSTLALPTSLASCLSASILWLVCWRLLSNLR
ncbi:uncharacterized protein [Panulirus ornatus]|uniref:uncharacterized protein n=1 Tax=Panulirus ornatus TaxID=150431 RepID=UPI003A890FD9